MATKQQLKKRWQTEEGQKRAQAVMEAVKRGATSEELRLIVDSLPFAEEVAPHLDLRGLQFNERLSLRNLDLSGSYLDYTTLTRNLLDCRMVETVFNGADMTNLLLQQDFTRASFIGTNLKGSRFLQANLTGANFTRAKLQSGSLREAICTGANFTKANLRFSMCVNADFRGANLTQADLTEATLGDIRFDAHTLLRGANLTGAAMNDEFQAFAEQAGAIIQESQGTLELAAFDAALAIMKEHNTDGHLDAVLTLIRAEREKMVGRPDYSWFTLLKREFPPEIMQEVEEALSEGISSI